MACLRLSRLTFQSESLAFVSLEKPSVALHISFHATDRKERSLFICLDR